MAKYRPLVRLKDLAREPFRIFFPVGTLAGVVGVILWPFYFLGITHFYPGQTHPRIMACGMFGGFIIGFLGTAMPRMLSAQPFQFREVLTLGLLHLAMVFSYAATKLVLGDWLFVALLLAFLGCLARRLKSRRDTPPPGFVLVGLALACALTASILAVVEHRWEIEVFWITLQRLLLYQGFVLLPILGISPFLLPRFFGLPNLHDFPEAMTPNREWGKKAALALVTGGIIIGSFVMEANLWPRTAHGLRLAAILVYLGFELPRHRAPKVRNTLGFCLRIALVGLPAGFLAVALFPGLRVTLLHLTLMGGFAVLMFVVATRVVFGHSGNLERLQDRNHWLLLGVGLMLLGMATRMSGDFWPALVASHYSYGAVLWIGGVLIWATYVLPKVIVFENEK